MATPLSTTPPTITALRTASDEGAGTKRVTRSITNPTTTTLLSVPMGCATTYSDIARKIGKPKAARAVGAAVGRNPISFVVPCHRVLGRSGALTGYHWGLARKQAIIGWEAGRKAAA